MSTAAPVAASLSPRLGPDRGSCRGPAGGKGAGGLTMRALAARLGMQAPSLYKHVSGKDDLEVLLIAQALRDQGAAMHAAIDGLPLSSLAPHQARLRSPVSIGRGRSSTRTTTARDRGTPAASRAPRWSRSMGRDCSSSSRRAAKRSESDVGVRARHRPPRAATLDSPLMPTWSEPGCADRGPELRRSAGAWEDAGGPEKQRNAFGG